MKLNKLSRISVSAAWVLAVLILCSPTSIFAQEEEQPPTPPPPPPATEAKTPNFRFGIHASPNISYISTKADGVENPANVKFGFGLMAIFNFAENYAFATGINIVGRGGELTFKDDNSEFKGDYSSQFLQIPLQLRMSTREFGYSTFFATFGGSVDMKLSEENTFNPQPIPEKDSYVNFFNATFVIGAGMEYALGGNTSLVAGIYYNQSLINNLEKDFDSSYLLIDKDKVYRFDYISIQLGILF